MAFSEAPDGGWGWVVALAAHAMHFLTVGLDRATGLFYREILKEMQQTSASTAGFSALLFSATFCCSPVAGVLCKYFGCRKVMMAGGVTSFLGILLSTFCGRLSLIYLTLGFMTGVGNGLAYTSGLLAVNDYFSRRKSAALGLATAGTGVGSFVLPLLTQYLIQEYSFRGCMLILSGLSLNLTVCGALLYPLPEAPVNEAEAGPMSSSKTASRTSTGGCQRFFVQLWANIDLKLFLNWQFSVFAMASLFISAGFKSVAVILPHHAQLSGLDATSSVMLISIAGACDTLSRFSLGLLFDIPRLLPHRRRIWSLGMLLTATSVAAFAFMHSFGPFVLVSVAFGFTSGLFVSQLYCVLGDLIGRERCRTGIGL